MSTLYLWIPNIYLELVFYLNLCYWTWVTVYLMLNLSPSQNVTLDLLYCTATGCPVFCGLWGFFCLVLCNPCVFRYKYFHWFYWVWCLSEEHERMCDFGPFTGQIHLWEVPMKIIEGFLVKEYLPFSCCAEDWIKTCAMYVCFIYKHFWKTCKALAFHMKFKEEYFIVFTFCCVHCLCSWWNVEFNLV